MIRRRTVAKLEDLREWLLDRIDGGEEMRGEDGLISDFIRQIDALPSEMGTIPSDPAAATPITDAIVRVMQAGWLSLGSSAPGAIRPLVEALEVFERENADLKQRLLPQFAGRAQRAEHERDALLEQLIAARSAPSRPDWAQQLPGAEIFDRAARYEYLRTLNPRKFAALYNEALMGVHQFDDLVDRYRDAGGRP